MNDFPATLPQVANAEAPCKCCLAVSPLYGVADFNKHCNIHDPFPLAGVPVYYYRCPRCGFIFATALDAFTRDDLERWIYNEQYIRVDPDYSENRPRTNADKLCSLFSGHPDLRILDYGGGNGLLGRLMRERGFTSIETYDPHVPEFAARPAGGFDLVVAFEVAEHATQPRETFFEMISLLRPEGMLLFSTPIQPANIGELGMNWWFIAPRNGHVSIHTPQSLRLIAGERGLRVVSDPAKVWHLMLPDEPPPFARHMKIPPPGRA